MNIRTVDILVAMYIGCSILRHTSTNIVIARHIKIDEAIVFRWRRGDQCTSHLDKSVNCQSVYSFIKATDAVIIGLKKEFLGS